MKTYILDIIPKLERHSKKLNDLTKFHNNYWILLEENSNSKKTFIFRQNNQLLISENGKVTKALWEYIGENSILLEWDNNTYLFKHGFLDNNVLILQLDNTTEHIIFISQTYYDNIKNSVQELIQELEKIYISNHKLILLSDVKVPKYSITNQFSESSYLRGYTKTYEITFEDGIIINLFSDGKDYYFTEKMTKELYSLNHYYNTFENCVSASYKFNITGKKTKEGYLGTLS